MTSVIYQNNPSDKEKTNSEIYIDFSNVEKEQKIVFCPACGRNVPLSFIVSGICKDCFNND